MALLASDCYRQIRHGLGGADPSDELALQEIVNDAGEWLLSVHQWGWQAPATAAIDTVADQEYVSLPSDFLRLIHGEPTDNIEATLTPVTRHTLLEYRTNSVEVSNFLFFYVIGYRANATTGVMEPVLELWPTPQTSATGKFTIWYQRTWDKVTSDSDQIFVPVWMEPCFKRVCRIFAKGYEDEDEDQPVGARGDLDDLLDRFMAGQVWQAAVNQDRLIQPNLGFAEGGHTEGFPHNTASRFIATEVQAPI